MPDSIKVCVVGAAGRMGRRLIELVLDDDRFDLGAALDRSGIEAKLPGGVGLAGDVSTAVRTSEVVVDFAAPPACAALAPLCAEYSVPYLIGSTGLEQNDDAALTAAAETIAVLHAANFSIGVNVLLELAETASARLGEAFEVEICEIHHRHKRDAPSGTALALRDAVTRGRGAVRTVLGRCGAGEPRSADELGIAALRGGDASGEHTVYFLGMQERVELSHRATSPDIFVRGALRAAAWLVRQPAGRYSMRDVVRKT